VSKCLTYFENMRNAGSKTVHRVTTGHAFTVCGLPLKGANRIAHDVTCKRCKDTNAYRRGSH
jgi:hypothetical protein